MAEINARTREFERMMDRVHLNREILYAINEADSEETAVQAAVIGACMLLDWPIGHACLRPTRSGTEAGASEVWQLSEADRYRAFKIAIEARVWDESKGILGLVSRSRRPVLLRDLTSQTEFFERNEAGNCGLKTAVAFSVMIGSDIVALIEVFTPKEAQISTKDSDVLEVIGSQLGRAFERSRQKRLIEEQRQKMITTSKMSALGEMAGGIAHEINNPLAALQSISYLVNELVAEEPIERDEVAKMTSMMVKLTDRISKIITGLRSFSRDGSHDAPRVVLIERLVTETLSFCGERFKSHGVELRVDPIPEGAAIECRETEITQVLLNLLNNAHDAVESREDRWVRLSVEHSNNGWVEIRVSDSGRGINPEILEKIFQPFFTTKEVGHGTGLGLSVSLGIVKGHQGELTVDRNSPNTCFVIRLPETQSSARLKSA